MATINQFERTFIQLAATMEPPPMRRRLIRSLALLSLIAVAGCWELPAGDKTSPDFWSDYFLDKYADELVVGELEPGPPPLAEARTVLLITGVTIRDVWFDPIVARLERDGFIPVVYEPPALLTYDLFQASEDLAAVVESVREASGQDRIDILAECTGGLIARYYIQSLGGDAHVSRLVTFVSPQNGVAKAPYAALIAGWPALYDLSPGSAFLRAVNDAPLPADVPITSIYSCTDEYIQPYKTAIIPGATNIGLCDGFVGHFQTFYDPAIYRIMFDALTAPHPSDEGAEGGVVGGVDPFTAPSSLDPGAGEAPQSLAGPNEHLAPGCQGAGGGVPAAALTVLLLVLALGRRRSPRPAAGRMRASV